MPEFDDSAAAYACVGVDLQGLQAFTNQLATTGQNADSEFAKSLRCIGVVGTLGAGKTEFVRRLATSLVPGADVTSPTFTLVQSYERNQVSLHHVDAYRINDTDEWFEAGLEELLAQCTQQSRHPHQDWIVVEWADRFETEMPHSTLWIQIEIQGDLHRRVALSSNDVDINDQLKSVFGKFTWPI